MVKIFGYLFREFYPNSIKISSFRTDYFILPGFRFHLDSYRLVMSSPPSTIWGLCRVEGFEPYPTLFILESVGGTTVRVRPGISSVISGTSSNIQENIL